MGEEAAPQRSQWPDDTKAQRTLILGLGSPILRDDAIGLHVTRALARRLSDDEFSILEAGVAGLALLPLLEGWDRIIIIDALLHPPLSDSPPCLGRLHQLSPDDLTAALNLHSSHGAGLAEVLTLGQWLGLDMPREVVIFGIEVEDPFTFDEEMSPDLAARVEALADEIAGRCANL